MLGGTSARGRATWQSVDHPTVVAVWIDTVPPRIPARITIAESDISWTIAFGTVDPEISLYPFKSGRPSETRCGDPAGYNRALVPFTSLPKANRPYLFCAIPYDSAFNAGTPFEAVLP